MADFNNHAVRRASPSRAVSTLAGSGIAGFADAQAALAQFNGPAAVAIGGATATVFVADSLNNRIRTIAQANGMVATLSGTGAMGSLDGPQGVGTFTAPESLAIAPAGLTLYVAERLGNRVRAVDTGSGAATTLAGTASASWADGTGNDAAFFNPTGLSIDVANARLFVGDTRNNRVRALSLSGAATTLAGGTTASYANGLGAAAAFNQPTATVWDAAGSRVVVADTFNNRVRVVDGATGATSLLAGTGGCCIGDGAAASALFNAPRGVAAGAAGDGTTFFVSESSGNTVRLISCSAPMGTPSGTPSPSPGSSPAPPTPTASASPTGCRLRTLAGEAGVAAVLDGTGVGAVLSGPAGIATNPATGLSYVVEASGHVVSTVALSGAVARLAGSGTAALADGQGWGAAFNTPRGCAWDTAGGRLLVADTLNNVLRAVTPGGAVRTLAGSASSGFADSAVNPFAAVFNAPEGVAVLASGLTAFLSDTSNHRIRAVTLTAGGVASSVATIAGTGVASWTDGPGGSATFYYPKGLALWEAAPGGGALYIADSSNYRIRALGLATGAVISLAGSGSSGWGDGVGAGAAFGSLQGLSAVFGFNGGDGTIATLIAADGSNNRVCAVNPVTGAVVTVAGTGPAGYADGPALQGTLTTPFGVAPDGSGGALLGEFGAQLVRRLLCAPPLLRPAPRPAHRLAPRPRPAPRPPRRCPSVRGAP